MDELEAIVLCSICLKWFENPRLLPCQHTFCLDPCLNRLYINKRIRCPLCREDHLIVEGPSGLPVNRTVMHLLDVSSLQNRQLICPGCSQRTPISAAASCDHCGQNLCSSCRRQHRLSMINDITEKCRNLKASLNSIQEVICTVTEQKLSVDNQVSDISKIIDLQCDQMIVLINRRRQMLLERIRSFHRTESRKADTLLQDFGYFESVVNELSQEILNSDTFASTEVEHLLVLKDRVEGIEKDIEIVNLEAMSESSSIASVNFTFDDSVQELISSFGAFNLSSVVGERNCEESLSWNLTDPVSDDAASEEDGDELHDEFVDVEENRMSPGTSPQDKLMFSFRKTSPVVAFKDASPLKCVLSPCGFAYSSVRRPAHGFTSHVSSVSYGNKGTPVLIFGGKGASTGCFSWPRGLAIDRDASRIAVADSSNSRCQIFSLTGEHLCSLGCGQGFGELESPTGVAVDTLGQLIVSDRYNHRLLIFDRSGRFVKQIGEEGSKLGQLNCPWGLACDNMGFIYVADKNNHRIQVFTQSGDVVRAWNAGGQHMEPLDSPQYLTLSSDSRKVFVSDTNNHRVMVYDLRGNFLQKIGGLGSHRGHLKHPRGVVVDARGHIVVADSGNNRVQVYNPDGSFLCCFGSYGAGPGQFRGLEGVALTPEGHVVVTDRDNHRIQVF